MRAARLVQPGVVEVQDVAEPRIDGGGQVLIRTEYATICGSDLHNVFAGTSLEPYPSRPGYPGHESVGVVIDSSSDIAEAGQHVLSVPDLSCSAAFADVQVVPDQFVIPIEREAPGSALVLAQQLGTVLWALDRFWPDNTGHGMTAAVIGTGTAGLFFVDRLRDMGFEQLIVSDLHEERLRRAQKLGANATAHAPEDDLVELVHDLTDGRGVDLVIEAAGEDATRATAVDAVVLDGRIGFFGTPSRLGSAPFPFDTFFRKRAIATSQHSAQHEPGHASFRRALDLVADGTVRVEGTITHWVAPEEMPEALNLAHHPRDGSLKIGIDFTGANT